MGVEVVLSDNITVEPTATSGSLEPIAYRNKNDLGKLDVRFDHQDTTTAIAYGSDPDD